MKESRLLQRFLNNEIEETTLMNRLGKDWDQLKEIAYSDPDRFGNLLRKLSLPNRRRFLIQVFNLGSAELRLLLLGKYSRSASTISDLSNPLKAGRRFSNELLAKFAILTRVPFDYVYKNQIGRNRWDYKSFDFAGKVVFSIEEIKDRLMFAAGEYRQINGYVLESSDGQVYYLRLERRTEAIIVDLYNPDMIQMSHFMNLLKATSLTWSVFINQSVVPGYWHWMFIGAEHESAIIRIKETEFKSIQHTMRLC